jgi:hypothetical protein
MNPKRCELCGSRQDPCPALWDGEPTFVGYYRCPCEDARREDHDREEDRRL